jgi:hypothetical protein
VLPCASPRIYLISVSPSVSGHEPNGREADKLTSGSRRLERADKATKGRRADKRRRSLSVLTSGGEA